MTLEIRLFPSYTGKWPFLAIMVFQWRLFWSLCRVGSDGRFANFRKAVPLPKVVGDLFPAVGFEVTGNGQLSFSTVQPTAYEHQTAY